MHQFTHEWLHAQFTQEFVLLMLMMPKTQSAPKQTSHFCVVQNNCAGD